ncbi:MAG: pseudouridine synthase [Aromatoleum sp.]|uniref:pseudouridine synthase n=1 Tax=Aromatoleum sp. TaxID=2307007 RepID=UPI0028945CCE|nr:pseudouridine synthase [Aromatoleum sp.]MDT3670380.1 pseudouridine synthase [Aromatoleum sp.]
MKRSSTPGDAGKTDPEVPGAPSDSVAAGGKDAATGTGRKTLGVKSTAASGDATPKKAGLRARFLPSAERRGTGKPPERNAGPKVRERQPRDAAKAAAADKARGPRREREGRGEAAGRDEAPRRGGREDRPRRDERPREDRGADRRAASNERGAAPEKRALRDERPARDDRGPRENRAERENSASPGREKPREGRRERDDRPARDDRGARERRPAREGRPAHEARASREDRSVRDDRRERDDRPARGPGPADARRPGSEPRGERSERGAARGGANPRSSGRGEREASSGYDAKRPRGAGSEAGRGGFSGLPGPAPSAGGRIPAGDSAKRKTVADERPPRTRRPEGSAGAPHRYEAPREPARAAAAPSEARAEGVRLSKVMADRGICSRREADAIIERGWVFVDGQRVSELGIRIDPNAEITLAAQAKRRQAEQVTILLHKPVGYVSGQPEPGFEPAVALIGPDNQFDVADAQRFHDSHLKGLAPAGRLDIDSTGLLVLTQNGRIARQLIGEDSKVEKEYLVRVEGEVDEGGLALLNHGLELDGRKLRPAKVEWLNEDQLRFLLREGRKRQIRRMCELVGLKVVGLKRVRIGGVRLGDLPLGQWRFLREDESF